MVKRGLDWTLLVKSGLDQWTGLIRARLVKGGLDSISKRWSGLVRTRLVKGGLDSLGPD